MLENNLALVVGCMPALAAFIRLQNSGSAFFKSLRSKMLGAWSSAKKSTPKVTGNTKEFSSSDGFKPHYQINRPAHVYYYEFNDNAPIMRIDDVPQEHEISPHFAGNQQDISKLTTVFQESHYRSPVSVLRVTYIWCMPVHPELEVKPESKSTGSFSSQFHGHEEATICGEE